MKTIAALTMFGVLALASAGTSGARGELGPTPGQPDPARVVLRSTDLGGARVTDQGYYRELEISYSRTFAGARVGGTALTLVESDAGVAASSSVAHDYVDSFRRFASTARGRAALIRAFQSADSSGLVISGVRVGAVRPIAGTSGWDVDVHFKLLKLPTEAHVAMFTANRFLGQLMMMGAPGRSLPHATVVGLARIMTHRFNTAQAPKNLTVPTIIGVPGVGKSLTVNRGTWANGPTRYAYQWGLCSAQGSCNEIQGATASTYIPTAADVGSKLVVWVAATNANGTGSAESAPVGPVVSAVALPAAVDLPTIIGAPVAGESLTATTGSWTGAPTIFTYAWERCDAQGANCTAVPGSAQTYALGPGDVGFSLVVAVTATNAGGSTTVASQPTAVVVSASS